MDIRRRKGNPTHQLTLSHPNSQTLDNKPTLQLPYLPLRKRHPKTNPCRLQRVVKNRSYLPRYHQSSRRYAAQCLPLNRRHPRFLPPPPRRPFSPYRLRHSLNNQQRKLRVFPSNATPLYPSLPRGCQPNQPDRPRRPLHLLRRTPQPPPRPRSRSLLARHPHPPHRIRLPKNGSKQNRRSLPPRNPFNGCRLQLLIRFLTVD